jgi:general secretion pathway protein C
MSQRRHQLRAFETGHPAPRGFRVFAAGIIALTAYGHAEGFAQLVRGGMWSQNGPVAFASESRPLPSAEAPPLKSAAAILERNPFDHERGPLREPEIEAPQAALNPDDVQRCKGITVEGLVAAEDPSWSFALLRIGVSESLLRRTGGTAGPFKVAYVFPRRVLLDRDGAFCQLVLGEAQDNPTAPASAASLPQARVPAAPAPASLDPTIASGIVRRSDTEYEISTDARDRVLANTASLLNARAVPVTQDGRTLGIRMTGVKPGSVLALIGIESGDVLMTVNGYEIADPQKALEAYARLRTAERMTLTLRRANRDRTVDFTVK